MRCRDAKRRLTAQRESELAQAERTQVQEHLKQCTGCVSFEKRQVHLDVLLDHSPSRMYPGISTERIMQAVERQKRITRQLETIQSRQHARMAKVEKAGPKIAGVLFLCAGVLIIGLLSLFLFQPDLFMAMLSTLSGITDVLYMLVGYLQAGLTLITSQNWVASGVALGIVILMGLWLSLMRQPREV